jgi:hypothetical protein
LFLYEIKDIGLFYFATQNRLIKANALLFAEQTQTHSVIRNKRLYKNVSDTPFCFYTYYAYKSKRY